MLLPSLFYLGFLDIVIFVSKVKCFIKSRGWKYYEHFVIRNIEFSLLLKPKKGKNTAEPYLFRRIIVYAVIRNFTRSLYRELDPSRNGVLNARWSIHADLQFMIERVIWQHLHIKRKLFSQSLTNQLCISYFAFAFWGISNMLLSY